MKQRSINNLLLCGFVLVYYTHGIRNNSFKLLHGFCNYVNNITLAL